ncbi:hypothetical protein ABIA45_004190 [Bradyrhizobium sp. USDA 336]
MLGEHHSSHARCPKDTSGGCVHRQLALPLTCTDRRAMLYYNIAASWD